MNTENNSPQDPPIGRWIELKPRDRRMIIEDMRESGENYYASITPEGVVATNWYPSINELMRAVNYSSWKVLPP